MLAEIYAGFNDVAKTTMEDDKKVTSKVVLPTKKPLNVMYQAEGTSTVSTRILSKRDARSLTAIIRISYWWTMAATKNSVEKLHSVK